MKQQYINDTTTKFKELQFKEKGHEYKVGNTVLTPTSNKVEIFCNEFPLMEASAAYAAKRGLTQQEVLDMWEDKKNVACELGTNVHNFAEEYVLRDMDYPIADHDPLKDRKKQVVMFWKRLPKHYSLLGAEQRMYSSNYGYAGTTDFLLYDHRDDTIVVGDYKTNRDLFKSYGKPMKKPFEYLEDHPYNHYQLQLSYYQILLEDIGIPVSNRVIVWIKQDEYKLFHPVDLTKQLRKTLRHES